SHLVTRQVIAQPGKRGRRPGRASASKTGHDAHAAAQHQLVTLDGKDTRVARARLIGPNAHLANQPATRPPAAQVDGAEAVGSPVRRFDRVLDVEEAFAVEDPRYHPAIRAQIGRYVVSHLGGKARRAG